MSLALKVTVAGLAALSAVACSSTPKQVTAPAVTAAPATSAAADATQVNSKLLGQGYKPVKVKNELVYCRMEAMTGTQFKKRVCLTEAAIHDLERQTQETQDSMTKQRTGPACFTKTC